MRLPPAAPERYRLYGVDALESRDVGIAHNLEGSVPGWARRADRLANRHVARGGGYGGDFAGVLGSLRRANRADAILSTVDTVGLPLVLLKRRGLVRPPVVYVAIGLPERLRTLRGEKAETTFRDALRRTAAVVAYSEFEAESIRAWLGEGAPTVSFLPFAVDTDFFRPTDRQAATDVLSVGADPRRDFPLLLEVAARRPDWRVRIVASAERASELEDAPSNIQIEVDVPLDRVRDRLASASAVALPVQENSYSGATTALLQALATGVPTVVSRTRAIATGYDLVDGENCRLVEPGDADALEHALADVLADPGGMGAAARRTAERFTWERYAETLERILRETA